MLADGVRALELRAIELAAPGARIVYATCSLLSEENERVADSLPGTPVALAEILGDARAEALGRNGSLTVTPHRHGTDGFFARVLRRA